jgi:hypothetical protein
MAGWSLRGAMLVLALAAGCGGALAQSTDAEIDQIEKKLDMNAKPDMGALGFQDDLAALEQCQSACRPLIERMLVRYKGGANYGGNGKLGTDDINQLAAAIGSAAATLSKEEAATVGKDVAAEFGAAAGAAFTSSYNGTTAPYDPQ